MRPVPLRDIARALLRVAAPLVLLRLSAVLIGVVDTIMAGQLGTAQVAAVGATQAVLFVGWVFGLGALMALEPIVGQAMGRGALGETRTAHREGRRLALMLSPPLMLFALVTPTLLGFAQQPDGILGFSWSYVSVYALTLPMFLIYQADAAFLTGAARTRALVLSSVVLNVANIGLNLALVHGWGPFPALGVQGIAWASVAAYALAMGWLIVAIARDRALQPIRDASPVPAVPVRRAIWRTGAPVGVQYMLEVSGWSAATLMMGWLGTAAQAGHQISLQVIAIPFITALAIGGAASGLIAQAIGRGVPREALQTGRVAVVAVGIAALVSSCMLWWVRPQIVDLFGAEGEAAQWAMTLLGVAAFFLLADSVQSVGFGILRGLGDTRVPMRFNVLAYWGLGLPLGGWLAFRTPLGPTGIWWGLCAALLLVAVALLARFELRMRRLLAAEAHRASKRPSMDEPFAAAELARTGSR